MCRIIKIKVLNNFTKIEVKGEIELSCGGRVYSDNIKLNEELNYLEELLIKNKGNKIRYRINGNEEFVNGVFESFKFDGNNVEIVIDGQVIKNQKINEVSFSEYEERTDFWIYGEVTNRFNLYN